MDVSEGEPPLKRRPQKRTLVAENNVVCGLTHHQWFDLILQRLLLEDLIVVKRTCKTFAAFKRIRRLIKDKEYSAYGDINKRYWNKLCTLERDQVTNNLFQNNQGRFLLFYRFCDVNQHYTYKFAVFSNKRFLWNAFVLLSRKLKGKPKIMFHLIFARVCERPHEKGETTIFVSGINSEIKRYDN